LVPEKSFTPLLPFPFPLLDIVSALPRFEPLIIRAANRLLLRLSLP